MIRFRPHHFLCALGYQGKGYSSAFTGNMDAIVFERLRVPEGGHQLIEVVGVSDDLCAPCPHRRGNDCEKSDKIAALDRRHAQHLGLKIGDVVNWQTAQDLIRQRVRPEELDTICQGCEWLGLGLCKQAVATLRRA